MGQHQEWKEFSFSGGALCLDFCNTADGDVNQNWTELLTSYADLAAWSYQAGIVAEPAALALLAAAERQPQQAAAVLDRARTFRCTLYRIFSALARADLPSSTDLDAFNAALQAALMQVRVVPAGTDFIWNWSGDTDDLDRVLGPVLWSAAELLTSEQHHLVRECGGTNCSWLFLDTSRNHSRRWCDMKGCGNRAKARRHYERVKAVAD